MRAHQHRGRHDFGAAQGQKHEEQHGEEARACRGQKRQGMRLDRERDGQRLAIGGGEKRRGQRAKNKADDDADPGEHERLDQIDGKHEPARGAERLEGGDDAALLRHVAADGVADADAAKEQRGQSDEADELGEALHLAPDRWRRIGPIVDGKAAFGELGLDGEARGVERRLVVAARLGQLQPVDPADQASWLNEAGAVERLERHQHPRAIGEAVGQPVRLGAEHAADGHRCVADRERAADADAKPLEQRLLGNDHPRLAPGNARVFRLADHDVAIERIGAIDGLHLDERAFAAVDPRHGAQACRFRHLAFIVERRALLFARRAGARARRTDRRRRAGALAGRAPRRTRR